MQVSSSVAASPRALVLCAGLRQKLFSEAEAEAAGLSIVYCADDHAACIAMCQALRPALFICTQPLIEQLTRADLGLHDIQRGIRIVAVVADDAVEVTATMVRLGCSGVISALAPRKTFKRAVLKVLQGEIWAPRRVVESIILDLLKQNTYQQKRGLTRREEGVLQLTLHGLKNIEIADRLGISAETVRWHKRRLYRKVGKPTRNIGTTSLEK